MSQDHIFDLQSDALYLNCFHVQVMIDCNASQTGARTRTAIGRAVLISIIQSLKLSTMSIKKQQQQQINNRIKATIFVTITTLS